MPIYDYVCSACDHRLEVIHGVHDAGPRFCSACGAEGTLRKAVVPPTIVFKGSGWAKKDRSSRTSPPGSTSTDTPSTDAKSTDATTSPASKDAAAGTTTTGGGETASSETAAD